MAAREQLGETDRTAFEMRALIDFVLHCSDL